MSGVEDDLKSLNEKLERVMSRLDYMEAILMESRKYPEIAQLNQYIKADLQLPGALHRVLHEAQAGRQAVQGGDDRIRRTSSRG